MADRLLDIRPACAHPDGAFSLEEMPEPLEILLGDLTDRGFLPPDFPGLIRGLKVSPDSVEFQTTDHDGAPLSIRYGTPSQDVRSAPVEIFDDLAATLMAVTETKH